jgi:hypothetical protein
MPACLPSGPPVSFARSVVGSSHLHDRPLLTSTLFSSQLPESSTEPDALWCSASMKTRNAPSPAISDSFRLHATRER